MPPDESCSPASMTSNGPGVALPSPYGAFPVGTIVEYFTDSSRQDADFPSGRPVKVQLSYPSLGAMAAYLIEPELRRLLEADRSSAGPPSTFSLGASNRSIG